MEPPLRSLEGKDINITPRRDFTLIMTLSNICLDNFSLIMTLSNNYLDNLYFFLKEKDIQDLLILKPFILCFTVAIT